MNFVLKMEVKYALNEAGNVKYGEEGISFSSSLKDAETGNATRCSRHDNVLIDLNASEHLISFSEVGLQTFSGEILKKRSHIPLISS